MIGKIIAGSSFGATVSYVMKEQSRILSFEGIEPPNVQDMVRDFKDQTLLNPRIKNAVGHISLSFSVKDADKLTDPIMAQIAREYMERIPIVISSITGSETTGRPYRTRISKSGTVRFAKNLQPSTAYTIRKAKSRYGANGCASRTRPSTPFTMPYGIVCPDASRGAIWRRDCRSKVLRPHSSIAEIPTANRVCCSPRTATPFPARRSTGLSASPS